MMRERNILVIFNWVLVLGYATARSFELGYISIANFGMAIFFGVLQHFCWYLIDKR
jgi:hypothetical protein